jgi:DNA-binding transcriptional regulator YiaG
MADLLSVASRANRAMHRRVTRLQRQAIALRRANVTQRRGLARLERGVARLRDAKSSASARPSSGPTMAPAAVRALRARLAMTRERFARLIGVSPGSIFLWETGRARPRAGSLARLRKAEGTRAKATSRRAARGR